MIGKQVESSKGALQGDIETGLRVFLDVCKGESNTCKLCAPNEINRTENQTAGILSSLFLGNKPRTASRWSVGFLPHSYNTDL